MPLVVAVLGLASWQTPDAFVVAHDFEQSERAARDLFRQRIEPVFRRECFGCHSADAKEVQGGLRLDSRSSLVRGGDSGPAVVVTTPDDSLLLKALRHEDGYEMPPDKSRLADDVIADVRRWIELGAYGPADDESSEPLIPFAEEAAEHWSFQPIVRPEIPRVDDVARVRNPIDAFVIESLEARDWKLAEPASANELIRRVRFSLTGLPPTLKELQPANDGSNDDVVLDDSAYDKLVEQLLASLQFGERQAQDWLDVVRYAETEGYEYDRHLPDAWRFRDYVIDSFNADKPFDVFVTEQLAGDEIDPDNRALLSASIFHRLGPVRRNAGNPEIALSRNEVLTERTDIIGSAFLGLTVGCARCHQHKLEPITQADYYHLQAYFAATTEHDVSLANEAEQQTWNETTERLKAQMAKLREQAEGAEGNERERFLNEIRQLDAQIPAPLATIPATLNKPDERTPIHVLRRGQWEQKGRAVGPRPLSMFIAVDQPELPQDVEQPRRHLAEWLTSPTHPLTARVIVNRIWQHHFGIGLVRTANDFGLNGESPSHPELLDWLAAELIESGWRLKHIHRLIVLSAAYRQSSRSSVLDDAVATAATASSAGAASDPSTTDPDNRLLWKFPRRRLTAEELRDAMLSVSGRLNSATGGASVMVPVDEELVGLLYKPAQWVVTADTREHDRRSIYLIAKRNLRLPFMESLDAPPLQTSCARRESSTHAPQALELLNGTLANDLARSFAERLRREAGTLPDDVVRAAFLLALGRSPNADELRLSVEFLANSPLEEFTLALFNLNEFAYVP